MKKLFLLILPFLSAMLHAEELRFVTVLSSPVGTFNRLEEVDPTVPVKSPVINFCTTLGNSGTVKLQGNKNPEVNTLKMSNAAKLGGNGKDYVLNELTMRHGGTLNGSRLLANVVRVPTDGIMGVSENLYSNSLTVAGAKTGKLYVNGTDAVIENAGPADTDMVWSNQYQTDKACDNAAGCAKQYLLKQTGSSGTQGDITCTEQKVGPCVDPGDTAHSYYWSNASPCDEVNGFSSDFEGKCVRFVNCEETGGVSSLSSESSPGNCWGGRGNVSCCSFGSDDSRRNTCGNQSWLDNESDFAYYTKPENATALCSKMGQIHKPENYWQWNGTNSMSSTCYLYYYINGNCIRLDVSCNQPITTKKQAILRTCKRS